MILPHDPATLMLLMISALVCLGAWANLFKLAGKWRFELFCFDLALGLLAVAVILALTVGNLGFDGFAIRDDLMNASKREWMFAFLGGMIFNFANMFLIAAMSVAGMALAFPLTFGVAFLVGSTMAYVGGTAANSSLLMVGGALIVAAVILNCSAHAHLLVVRHERQARDGQAKSTRRPSALKGILLALVGGILMGTFLPLVGKAENPDIGLGPYSLMVLFAGGVVVSTFVFNLFFMNLPVEGDPLEFIDYLGAPLRRHIAGLIAGGVWALGATAVLAVTTPKGDTHLPDFTVELLTFSVPLLAALCGLIIWREYRGSDFRVKIAAVVMLLAFACGVAALSLASLYVRA